MEYQKKHLHGLLLSNIISVPAAIFHFSKGSAAFGIVFSLLTLANIIGAAWVRKKLKNTSKT